MQVTYLDHMGSDLTVVNAARVSFAKQSDWVQTTEDIGHPACDDPIFVTKKVLAEKDTRLIRYLVKHGHVLPFRHPHVSFHFKAPIFVARQLVKHQVGMSWSEISRRYVTSEPEFYWPKTWRAAAPDKKQGSAGALEDQQFPMLWGECAVKEAFHMYEVLLESGVAPEQARMILPQSTYTEWVWTGSLLSWAHLWKLRVEHSAQQETQDCVRMIGPDMERLFPVSWGELIDAEG